MLRALTRVFLVPLLLVAAGATAAESPRAPIVVFAAASLTDALQQISAEYTKASGVPVKLSFAASSALAKQIESGARADVFFSADQEWMDYLEQKALLERATRMNLLGNRLALIAPQDSKVTLELGPGAPLLGALGSHGRLSTADPDSVPAGKYAKSALASLGLWEALQPRLVHAENVRTALMYVARGEAPLGIVYVTDAAVEPRVKIVGVFPQTSHQPITYPVAAIRNAATAAREYLEFLRGPVAGEVFAQRGFALLEAR